MEYPDDFPEELQPPVDAALHDSEGEFLDAKKASEQFSSDANRLLSKYVKKVFIAFAYQAAVAWEQRLWNGERTRQALEEALGYIARYAHSRHHQDQYSYDSFEKDVTSWIKNSDEWRKIQDRLKEVAESQSTATALVQPPAETRDQKASHHESVISQYR
jgi:hypothetical protein